MGQAVLVRVEGVCSSSFGRLSVLVGRLCIFVAGIAEGRDQIAAVQLAGRSGGLPGLVLVSSSILVGTLKRLLTGHDFITLMNGG